MIVLSVDKRGKIYMKQWLGSNFEYRGFHVKNDKASGCLVIYDQRGNYVTRVESFGKGSVTEAKYKIDKILKHS